MSYKKENNSRKNLSEKSEVHSEASQISKFEVMLEIGNGFKLFPG